MELQFGWTELNGRHYPFCVGGGSSDGYDYLGAFLCDDGGHGLGLHILHLQEARTMCRRVLDGVSTSECFVAECFAADISVDGVWVSFITEDPTSCARFALTGFTHALDKWIDFLEAGVRRDDGRVEIHADL